MSEQDVAAGLWHSLLTKLNQDERLTPALLGYLPLVEPKGTLGETLYLEVPNDLTRDILEQRIRPSIIDHLAANAEFGGPTNFAIVVNPDIAKLTTSEPTSFSPPQTVESSETQSSIGLANPAPIVSGGTSVASHESRLNPKYTFDSFVIGRSNHLAHATAFAVAEAPAKSYNPLFIYGNSGLGKTHLLHAIGHYAINLNPRIRVRYVSSEEFTNDFINAIQNNRASQFQAQYRDIDILLIDDIQFLRGKDQTQEAFFHTFNTLHDHNKQVVITSDLPPNLLTGFEDRMVSRFAWGLSADIQAPELETRIAILRKKVEKDRLNVPSDILAYIAERVSSNIRELEGTLIRVTAFANLNRRPVDMQLVQTVLKDMVPTGHDNTIDAQDIIKAVTTYYGITKEDLCGKSRIGAIANARQIAMYICRELTNLSLPKIGQIFGDRDHTTVMYANKKVADLMKERRSVYTHVTEIINRIKSAQRV